MVTDITIFDFFIENSLLGISNLSKFGEVSFQEYISGGFAYPIVYGDLVKKVKRPHRQQNDTAIMKRTIGLVIDASTTLYIPFLKRCNQTNKAPRILYRVFPKPPQKRHGSDSRPL